MDVIAHDFAATAAPTAQDDERRYFRPGSVWRVVGRTHFYLCLDATTGAAVWERLPLPATMQGDSGQADASSN